MPLTQFEQDPWRIHPLAPGYAEGPGGKPAAQCVHPSRRRLPSPDPSRLGGLVQDLLLHLCRKSCSGIGSRFAWHPPCCSPRPRRGSFRDFVEREGARLYMERGDMHMNAAGQALAADLLFDHLCASAETAWGD